MSLQPTVMKFGGTSVEDARAFARVTEIVRSSASERPVVVVSAISGFTDALVAAVERAASGEVERATLSLEEHLSRHTEVARTLMPAGDVAGIEALINEARDEIADALAETAGDVNETARLRDRVVAFGERLSAALMAAVLRSGGLPARYVDTRMCVRTDEEFGCATPVRDETERCTQAVIGPLLAAGDLPVMGGFIAGSARTGETTTLGRGGSDFTAALVGAALHAREIQIWTDVPGVMTADPRVVREARSIPRLSYAEAAELAFFGAKVLHPKTILPAVVRHIPVRICNSRDPGGRSTVVYFDAEMTPRTVKAIACKTGIHIVHITSARMLGAYGFLRAIFEVFERHRTAVDIVATSEVSISLSLEETGALDAIIADLEPIAAVRVETNRAIICIVGEGLRSTPGIAGRVFSTIKDINVLLISQGASNINLTFVIEDQNVKEAVRRLHAAFFECATAELLTHIGGKSL